MSKRLNLEMHRSLNSYRLSPGDILVIQDATANHAKWKLMTDKPSEIAVIISSDEFNVQKVDIIDSRKD